MPTKTRAFTPVTTQGVAPGRLDFLGGVADYSGSLVLQSPISTTTHVAITTRPDNQLQLTSSSPVSEFSCDFSPLMAALHKRCDPATWRGLLAGLEAPDWTHYPLGCLYVFSRAKDWVPDGGLEFFLESDVPQNIGVSSSAALEIATLRALGHLSENVFSGTELARLGQEAENKIVGAPCGLMDQLASAFGRPQHLLPIVCRPDILLEAIRLPENIAVIGWPAGTKQSGTGAPYAAARTGAFMGKKIFEAKSHNNFEHSSEIPPSTFALYQDSFLPEKITGQEFIDQYVKTDDPYSVIQPQETYPVRACLRYPVEENFRCSIAANLLRNLASPSARKTLTLVGELMLQSHVGYCNIGLGTPETDKMVDAAMQLGPEKGIYGARLSGSGGGTVVALVEKTSIPRLQKLAEQMRTGGGKVRLMI
ncbi:MAG: galactokinase [Candidatus Methylacidiphilales bacterium]|nr:hypothetical protein [Candidatus Methylacidiphilales bacterium]